MAREEVTIRSKEWVGKDDEAFGDESGWQVSADIHIGGNTWSGPHFLSGLKKSATDEAISIALITLYGG